MTEQEIQKSILTCLGYLQGVIAWRQNTGVAKANGFRIRFGHVGSGDISGILRGGRRLEIEVKTPKGIVTEEQIKFGEQINSMGGLWFVARSTDEAVARVQAALAEVR